MKRNDPGTLEVLQRGDTEKRCPDCGIDYPAQIQYHGSGNNFLHLYEEEKCITRFIGGNQ